MDNTNQDLRSQILLWLEKKSPSDGIYHNGGAYHFPTLQVTVTNKEESVDTVVFHNSRMSNFSFSREEIKNQEND